VLCHKRLFHASSSPLGAIVYAEHAHLGAGVLPQAPLFSQATSCTPNQKAASRFASARLLLSGSSSATLTQEKDGLAAILTTGSAIFSTANSKAFAIHVAAAVTRPCTDLPTIDKSWS